MQVTGINICAQAESEHRRGYIPPPAQPDDVDTEDWLPEPIQHRPTHNMASALERFGAHYRRTTSLVGRDSPPSFIGSSLDCFFCCTPATGYNKANELSSIEILHGDA